LIASEAATQYRAGSGSDRMLALNGSVLSGDYSNLLFFQPTEF